MVRRLRFKQLNVQDRALISYWKSRGAGVSEIALRVGVHKSTISRELRRNAQHVSREDQLFYMRVRHLLTREQVVARLDHIAPELHPQEHQQWNATEAQRMRDLRLHHANQLRRRKSQQTRRWVIQKLKAKWSPEQIAGRSRISGPEAVSHEYVYLLLKEDKKQGGSLHRHLRRYRKRKQRFGNRTYPSGPIIPHRIGIENRPKIVDKRVRLGDLEADLILGYRSSGYILTVVDRKSRFLVLRKLRSKRKVSVRKQLQAAFRQIKKVHTLTLDNGSEFCDHVTLTGLTKVPVYFAHPYCSSERGTVENTNGLIRYYLPKKTSFAGLSQRGLNKIQNQLNDRPRECLNFLTPDEVHFKRQPIKSGHGRPLHL